MNAPDPADKPEKKASDEAKDNTDPRLSEEDMKRVCDVDDPSCAPLVCSEDDCFIPGSELDHQVPPTPPHQESE